MFFLNSNGDTIIKMNLDIFYKGRTPFLWYKFILEINKYQVKRNDRKKPEPPAGIEPTTFPIPVGRSNHLAIWATYMGVVTGLRISRERWAIVSGEDRL